MSTAAANVPQCGDIANFVLPRSCDTPPLRPGRRRRQPIETALEARRHRQNMEIQSRAETRIIAAREEFEAQLSPAVQTLLQIERDGSYEFNENDVLFVHRGPIGGCLHYCVIKTLGEAYLFEFSGAVTNVVTWILIDASKEAWLVTDARIVEPAEESDPFTAAARRLLALKGVC